MVSEHDLKQRHDVRRRREEAVQFVGVSGSGAGLSPQTFYGVLGQDGVGAEQGDLLEPGLRDK